MCKVSNSNIIQKLRINVYKNQYSNSHIKTKDITFLELVEWLKCTTISNDKFSNFTYLIGEMKETHRNDGNVINRHALAIDIDDLPPSAEIVDEIKNRFNFSYILYSTHNHTPTAPRYRLIIPLSKPITKKHYKPALKLFADQLEIKFDEQAFDFSRCMARTTLKSLESEFIFEYQDSYFIDTDNLIKGLDQYMNDEVITLDYSGIKRDSSHWLDIGLGVASGGRNTALASITGHLARCGVDINLMVALLTNWNLQNEPPIEQKEFERTIKSILKKEQQRLSKGG
ncbi:hypothetical protein EVU91_02325 [Macrococcoides bohemicum]|uniref:primase C-terminal domain-containing protein n=1 Tax=Macrococcoides bohemicum TaxID=1903056 RepID=UPI001059994D|nr:primase C-terminal domain-containing protein [Macrococcus bohemicus]TDL40750.1 hypothetical protein EVU91_02325 [Macrococcus bohemicus]